MSTGTVLQSNLSWNPSPHVFFFFPLHFLSFPATPSFAVTTRFATASPLLAPPNSLDFLFPLGVQPRSPPPTLSPTQGPTEPGPLGFSFLLLSHKAVCCPDDKSTHKLRGREVSPRLSRAPRNPARPRGYALDAPVPASRPAASPPRLRASCFRFFGRDHAISFASLLGHFFGSPRS